MKQLLALCICIAFLINTGCRFRGKRVNGNGNVTTETRNVQGFSKIRLAGSMDVVLDSGATSVRVEAESNIIPYVITRMRNGALEINFKNNINITTHRLIKVYVTTPTISDIQVAGSGSISSGNKFWSSEPMHFDIGGSGNINMDVHAPMIVANSGGSGNFNLAGETRDVKISIAGSGDYRGMDMKAENADVKIAGSGNVSVFADVSLKVSIAGSGDVRYKGNATVSKSIMGSGSVEKKD